MPNTLHLTGQTAQTANAEKLHTKVEKPYPNPNGYKVKVLDAERSRAESRLLHALSSEG